MFDNTWRRIVVNFEDDSFSLVLPDKKTVYICRGKIAANVKSAENFTVANNKLVYTPTIKNVGYEIIVEKYKAMLEVNKE